jgi:predicted ATPase/class 3 adenylate cyclase
MKNPPSGNVTFLFTDIEGSTQLAQEFSEKMPEALIRHNDILNKAVETNGGIVFKTVGDAFCCAFENPENAVNAGVEIQLNLQAEDWKDFRIKVRIGIHCGNAVWNGYDYSGYVTLARVQRIMSAAFGEQIIISDEVYELLIKNDYYSATFRDLGERRLKDLIKPLKLFQIISKGLREEFPPLNTLDARPNNLPVQLTRFIGREKEMRDIKDLLSNSRLLTLLGPGGTGKTRLTLQTGADMIDEFANGVWLVELASVSDPVYVEAEIASVFSLNSDGKKELIDIIRDFMREKELLIILDNCEHLIAECAKVSEQLLQFCSKLKILTSSREPLHISGEATYRIPSLSLPDSNKNYTNEELSQYESVQLFIDRALSVNPDFKVTNQNAPALAQLCHDIDGIPLAIELAAARIRVLSVEKILERLSDRFRLLTGGKRTTLPRHQTLRALIDWSYDLLSDYEKLLLQRLSVFCGGWTLEAAEFVCQGEPLDEFEILDLLSNLLDKSLVKASETHTDLRYNMLETIHKYAEEKLSDEEKFILRRKMSEYYYRFIEDSEIKLTGSEQREWLNRINSDYENIREVIRWTMDNEPEYMLSVAVALGKYWELRSYFSEGLGFLIKGLEKSETADNLLKARVYYWSGFYLSFLAKYSESKKYFEDSLLLFIGENNKEGEAKTIMGLASIALFEGNYEKMESMTKESLALSKELNNKSLIASNLRALAVGQMQQSKHEESRKNYEESLSIFRELEDQVQLAKIIGNLGALEYLSGNYDKAIELMEESLNLRYELGDRHGIALSLSNLGSAHSMKYDFEKSENALYKSIDILKEIGDRRLYVTPLNTLGNIANEKKEYERAIKLFNESIVIASEIGEKYYFMKGIEGLANSYIGMNDNIKGCLFSAKYITMMKSLNTNLTAFETDRMKEITEDLRKNLNETDFESYWRQGENLTTDEAVELALS